MEFLYFGGTKKMISKGKLNPVGLVWSWTGEFGQELNRCSHTDQGLTLAWFIIYYFSVL